MKRTALNLLASILCFIVTACGSGTTSSTSSTPTMASFSRQIIAKSSVVKSVATATTEAQKMAVIKMFQAMFNAAPGADLLNLCADFLADGMTESTLANLLTGTALFQIDSLYPVSLSNQNFSTKFLNNLVGLTVSEANKTSLASQMAQLLDGGWQRGDLMWLLVSALSSISSTDQNWGIAAAQLNNKLDVSYYYSATKAFNSGDLATLQSVTASITSDPVTVNSAKTAMNNIVPIANAGSAQSVTTSKLVVLDGSSSNDANGDSLTYNWSLASRPTGSSTTLSSATVTKPTFTADVAGSYIFNLVVHDGISYSEPATVIITAKASAKITISSFIRSFTVYFDPTTDVDLVGYVIHAVPARELVDGLLAAHSFQPYT